jgi:tetratricopeptide (TPR) repeat protein
LNEIIINNIVLLIIKSKGVSQSSWTIDSLQSEYIKCGSIDSLQRKKASLSLQLCYYSIDIAPIKAFEFGKLTLDWATINNDKLLQAYANTYLSSIENSLGNRLKSIGYAIKSASIFRELEMYVQEGTSLIAIGNVFALEGDALNTLRYYHQALQVFKSYGDTLYYESVLNNIGEFYRKNGNTDSALVYYNLCLEYLENIKNSKIKEDSEYNKAIVLGNIGMVYLANSDYNKAELPLKQACEFFSINFDPYRNQFINSV